MKAVVIGAVESTRVALQTTAAAAGWEVDALVTLPRNLAGRHSDFADLSMEAEKAGARLILTADSNTPEVIEAITELDPDIVMVIGWSQICRANFLDAVEGRVIGYHPAPLPQLRGRAVIPWTILLQYPITASTLFWLDRGVDSGPILGQRFFHVAPDETATSLYRRHLEALRIILSEALEKLARGEPPRVIQDERYATWAARRVAEDGRIDWRRPAAEVWRLIRAATRPYPGAFTSLDGENLLIWQAEPWAASGRYAAAPGQVIDRGDDGFAVCCGDGDGLRVTEWETPSGAVPRLHARLGIG